MTLHPKEDPSQNDHSDLGNLWRGLVNFLKKLVDLRSGLDREGTIQNIKDNKRMQGANAWLLMCSIMIASLGLDLNSQAIIIGAMLISPLMSPILGIGLGIGTNDRSTLLISLRHFTIAIAIAVITSTFYFFITPFGSITEEILRRTEPTFLDVLVAFFGGIAGIISGSQKDKSNALPGVAIATALMPPLCVTGFGIATWMKIGFGLSSNISFDASAFIVNSFYLFHLNAFFVAAATFLIVRHLRFPFREYANRKNRIRTSLFIGLIGLGMAIPSFMLLGDVITNVRAERSKDQFITDYFGEDAKYIDESILVRTDEGQKLILKVYGSKIDDQNLATYQEGVDKCGLINTKLEIIPTSEIDLKTFKALQAQVKDIDATVDDRIREAKEAESRKTLEIKALNSTLDSIRNEQILLVKIRKEVEIFVDDISNISTSFNQDQEAGGVSINIFWNKNKSDFARRRDREKIKRLVADVYQRSDIRIIDQ